MRWVVLLTAALSGFSCRRAGDHCVDWKGGRTFIRGSGYKACNHACTNKDYIREWNADNPGKAFKCICSEACPCRERH